MPSMTSDEYERTPRVVLKSFAGGRHKNQYCQGCWLVVAFSLTFPRLSESCITINDPVQKTALAADVAMSA